MGILLGQDGARHELVTETVIGRSRSATIRVSDDGVSGQHCELRWTGSGWTVRDLGSRNGSFVLGRRLERGEDLALHPGGVLVVSHLAFRVEDDGPPRARAVCGDDVVVGTAEALMLGEDVTFFLDGGWRILDAEGERRWDGDSVQVEGRTWRLELPEVVASTNPVRPELGRIRLVFHVPRCEEGIALQIVGVEPDRLTFIRDGGGDESRP